MYVFNKCLAQQIESYLKLAHPHNCLCPLSTQGLTSCTPNPLECGGSGGCYGSIVQLAFLHVNFMGIERYLFYFATFFIYVPFLKHLDTVKDIYVLNSFYSQRKTLSIYFWRLEWFWRMSFKLQRFYCINKRIRGTTPK